MAFESNPNRHASVMALPLCVRSEMFGIQLLNGFERQWNPA